MKTIYQENIVNTVEHKNKNLISKTTLLNRDLEITATMIVDIYSFQIQEAFWETLKVDSGSMTFLRPGIHKSKLLEGEMGYIAGKKKLNDLLKLPEGEILKYLFGQCINGLIQSETYVYQERGFRTKEEYNAYWDLAEENGCRMYSRPDKMDLKWMDYVPPLMRKINLFNRMKNYRVYEKNKEFCVMTGSFSDSFHEINVDIIFSQSSGNIVTANIEFCRAPGKACFENAIHSNKLLGENMYQVEKKQVVSLFGGAEGCYHLTEMILDMTNLIKR
ncbi:DUF2889 domain-containing protein [Clostridium aminobutyricum]|uniref:DUF2889 domain-containing protein n=1 Tax=Clostridium aminobutyricum TaxID=33953 RepID=A0A939DAA7_CLOAM|nr:DUF2889 domain-containing protein [Clostridium aminobutyricum]MBN7773947.1 DUF2889 domain-containing protein [Clostridium aminobutyricum]